MATSSIWTPCPPEPAHFDDIADPQNRLRNLTLPFEVGLAMTVRIWRAEQPVARGVLS